MGNASWKTRNKWKGIVQSCINKTVQNRLKIECKTMKKTSALSFISPFRISQYLVKYLSDVAIMLFRIRSNSTNCAVNRGSNIKCRLCGEESESQSHVLNCKKIRGDGSIMTLQSIQAEVMVDNEAVTEIAKRFIKFEKEMEHSNMTF